MDCNDTKTMYFMDRISLGYQKTMYFADRIVVSHTSISRPTITKSNIKIRDLVHIRVTTCALSFIVFYKLIKMNKKESVDNRGVGQTDGGNQLMLIKIPCILWVGFNFSLKNNAFCGSILRAQAMPQQ